MTDPQRTLPAHAARIIVGIGLLAVLKLELLLALLSGLAAYALYCWLYARAAPRVAPRWRHTVAVVLFWVIAAVLLALTVRGFEALHIGAPSAALARLTELMADSLERLRAMLPPGVAAHLPDSVETLRASVVGWLRAHGAQLRGWGMDTVRAAVHLLVGGVIGLLAALQMEKPVKADTVFLQAWRGALTRLAEVFTGVMGAQLRIAAINTAFTAVYLLALAPLLEGPIPLARGLVLLTFVCGLIPVLGNLASNTAIVLASLAVSPTLALLSLLYLLVIHKLEYFLNARLVGNSINARTYELLAVMLLMETVFGLRGVAAAPIYYAWLMGVLREEDLV